jgi:hypothetical protein
MMDGAVRFVADSVDPQTMAYEVCVNDGQYGQGIVVVDDQVTASP